LRILQESGGLVVCRSDASCEVFTCLRSHKEARVLKVNGLCLVVGNTNQQPKSKEKMAKQSSVVGQSIAFPGTYRRGLDMKMTKMRVRLALVYVLYDIAFLNSFVPYLWLFNNTRSRRT
jgi:hypothetical protein